MARLTSGHLFAFGIGAWLIPAVEWAAYLWCGRPHPIDPGCTRPALWRKS